MVMLHDRQRWSKSCTTKGLLLALTLSHQVTQHLFRKLDIVAEWTGFDHGRAIVFVTGLTKSGNVHRYSSLDGSVQPCIMLVFQDAVLVALVLESQGAGGHANSSNNALASLRSAVSKPSMNQLYTGASRSWASWRFPWRCQSRARLVAARSSSDLACWFWAIAMAWAKQDSASA